MGGKKKVALEQWKREVATAAEYPASNAGALSDTARGPSSRHSSHCGRCFPCTAHDVRGAASAHPPAEGLSEGQCGCVLSQGD